MVKEHLHVSTGWRPNGRNSKTTVHKEILHRLHQSAIDVARQSTYLNVLDRLDAGRVYTFRSPLLEEHSLLKLDRFEIDRAHFDILAISKKHTSQFYVRYSDMEHLWSVFTHERDPQRDSFEEAVREQLPTWMGSIFKTSFFEDALQGKFKFKGE